MLKRNCIIFVLVVILSPFVALCQPDYSHGCKFIHDQASRHKLTKEETSWFLASVERSDSFDILDYDLTIDLKQMSNKLLRGKAILTFKPKMAGLSLLPLDLLKMTIDSVYFENDKVNYDYNTLLLNIPTPLLELGREYQVTVYYHGNPTTSPSGFGGFYFEDGYAYNLGIGLTDDPHNFGRSWFPCFDNFVERSTYTYRVLTPVGQNTYTVGNIISIDTLDEQFVLNISRINQEIPTYLSAIAVSNYQEYSYDYDGLFGKVPIRIVSKTQDFQNLKSSFANVGKVTDALQNMYGKYPFDKVGYVMTTRGAMEHPNNIAYPVGSIGGGDPNYRLMAHELCHLWWGDLTTLKTQADMWIKEGNAEYGAHLFTEYFTGKDAFELQVTENRNKSITTAHTSDGKYLPLSPMPKNITYGVTTYNKGAMVLHSLRGYLGDELFKKGQQEVLSKNAYKNLTADSYRDDLMDATGIDLTDFFNRWVKDSGFFDFVVHDFQPNTVKGQECKLSIRQGLLKASKYCIDAPVTISFLDDKNQLYEKRMICNGYLTEASFPLDFIPKKVFLNYPLTLNLASMTKMHVLKKTGIINFQYTDMIFSVKEINADSVLTFIEHHLTAPDRHASTSPYIKVSNSHFWKITYSDPSKISTIALVNYNSTFDKELLINGEDSIRLLYRKDANSPWKYYPESVKIMDSPTDKRGSFRILNAIEGEYTFGNGGENISTKTENVNEFTLSPNPANNYFKIDWKNKNLTNSINMHLYDESGHEVLKQTYQAMEGEATVNLPQHLYSGNYYCILSNSSNDLYFASKLILLNNN